MPSSTAFDALSARPAPIWSAPFAAPAKPMAFLNDMPANSASCSITRHAWVVMDEHGRVLDPQGIWTDRLEWAWWPLDPEAAAARLQQLGIDLTGCRLVPVTLTAHPSAPWQWRADG